MSIKRKIEEFRSKNLAELDKQLAELRNELSSLRVQKVSSGTANKVSKIGYVRKQIARVLTIMHQKKLEEVKASYSGSKHLPKNLRAKKTRAMRRRLTPYESSRMTLRQRKRNALISHKVYGLTN